MTTRRSWVLVVVFAAVWALATWRPHGTVGVVAIDGLSAAAVGLAWWSCWRRGRGRLPWVLMAAGLTCWLIGDVIWDAYVIFSGATPNVSPADVFYLAAYPMIAGGLGVMVYRRAPKWWRRGGIDGLAAAAVAGLAAWQYLIVPGNETVSVRVISAAYPMADVLLLGVFVWLVLSPGGRGASTWFMAGGVAGVLAIDLTVAVYARTAATWGLAWWNNSYPIVYLLMVLALVHRSADELTEPDPRPSGRLHPARVVFLGAALLGAPILATIGDSSRDLPRWPFLAVTVGVGCIVLARFLGAVREVENARETMAFQATHDALTGLCNRAYLMTRLSASLVTARRFGSPLVVFYVDLDRFKPINDTLGHGAGDQLLRQVGCRLDRLEIADAFVARLGGDEFVIVTHQMGAADAQATATAIVDTLVEPFDLDKGTVVISASVGVALSQAADTAERVLKRADNALYQVKRAGRNGWQFAPDEIDQEGDRIITLPT